MIRVLARKGRAAVDVIRAAGAVRRARRLVADRPVGDLVTQSDVALDLRGTAPLDGPTRRIAERWGTAVDRAVRWMPGESACLVRATALQALVAAAGLPRAEVRIGVRRGSNGFEAHAWVELDGTAIAEPVRTRGAFAALEGVTLRQG